MFAVIKTGGKQYTVAQDDVLRVERLSGEPGDIVELAHVLMVGGGDGALQVGAPLVEGATVAAEVLEQTRAAKIIVFKKKRRKNYRRTAGHRQHETILRITEILTEGRKPSKAKAKPAPAPAKEAAAEAKTGPAAGKAAKKAVKPAAKKPAPKKAAPKKAAAKKTAPKGAAKKASPKAPAKKGGAGAAKKKD